MASSYNPATRDAVSAAFLALFAGGSFEIRSGAAPGAANAATGTVLATLALATPAFEDTGDGIIDFPAPITDSSADGTGTAGHFRVTKGSYVFEGTVGTSAADLIVDSVSFTAGQSFSISALAITFGQ